MLEKSHLYNPRWRFEAWLFSIARNLAIDLLRRRQPESLDALLHPDDERAAREWPDRESATPFETVAAGEQAERVKGVLRRLPPDAREVLVLRFQEDMNLDEIAEVVGAPLSTVKSRLYRGLETLAQSSGGGRGMNPEVHERACRLIDAWHVEGISAPEREWLDAHLAECAACRARARANERALQAVAVEHRHC